jgi:DNA topoisomerase IA
MKVILTEKPAVARSIASCLHINRKHDGYFEGNGYQIVWAFGHLVELKEPDDYKPEWKRWTLESLPIIPEQFERRCGRAKATGYHQTPVQQRERDYLRDRRGA